MNKLSCSVMGLVLVSVAACEVTEVRTDSAPEEASSMAYSAVTVDGKVCARRTPVKVADQSRSCSAQKAKAKGKKKGKSTECAQYSPPLSDQCQAEAQRSTGIDIDYSVFGQADCRSGKRTRSVKRIVLHNGGTGAANNRTWQCRRASSHYTVNRDGTIVQHIGEERTAWHAAGANADSIGIELETKVNKRGRATACNALDWKKALSLAKREGLAAGDIVADHCAPSHAQTNALRQLIKDIKARHNIQDIIGHCEVDARHDPRAFDWRSIGRAGQPSGKRCEFSSFYAVRTRVVRAAGARPGLS